jgi:hypothetical protein
MFSTNIDMDVLNEIEDFLSSGHYDFVQSMNDAGLSFSAMAFVIDSIVKAVANAKNRLNEKSED